MSLRLRKILITGANGFIGRFLVRHLLKESGRVCCMVRKTADLSSLDGLAVEKIYGDIRNKENCLKALKGMEIVINLAAATTQTNSTVIYEVNLGGVRNIIEAAEKCGVKKIIQMSTIAAAREFMGDYGRSKSMADKELIDSGMNVTIFRPTLIYGPGPGSFFKFLKNLNRLPVIPVFGDGNNLRQPVYIEDILRCIDSVLNDKPAKRNIYEIGGRDRITMNKFIDKILNFLGKKKKKMHLPPMICAKAVTILNLFIKNPFLTIDHIYGLMQQTVADISPAIEELKFSPVWLDTGLKKTFQFWNKDGFNV